MGKFFEKVFKLAETAMSVVSQSPAVLQALGAALCLLLLICGGLGICCHIVAGERDAAIAAKADLSAKLELQNEAVDAWKREAENQKGRADQAAAKAATVRVRTVTRIERIAADPVPGDCLQAVQWGAKAGAESGSDWEDGK